MREIEEATPQVIPASKLPRFLKNLTVESALLDGRKFSGADDELCYVLDGLPHLHSSSGPNSYQPASEDRHFGRVQKISTTNEVECRFGFGIGDAVIAKEPTGVEIEAESEAGQKEEGTVVGFTKQEVKVSFSDSVVTVPPRALQLFGGGLTSTGSGFRANFTSYEKNFGS